MAIKEQPQNAGHVLADGTKMVPKAVLYDINVQRSSHAEEARTLAARQITGTLCSVSKRHDAYPYGSFVTYAIHNGKPIFLISGLAEQSTPKTSGKTRKPRYSFPTATVKTRWLRRGSPCLASVANWPTVKWQAPVKLTSSSTPALSLIHI